MRKTILLLLFLVFCSACAASTQEDKQFELHNLGNGNWQITGKKIERMVAMTSLVSDDSLKRLLIKMRNMGVDDALRNAGAQDGDNVAIGEFEFDFYE